MNWLLTLFYLALFSILISRNRFFYPENIPRWLVMLAFLLKVLAGISLGYVYAYYYHGEGDTFKYFWDANTMHDIMLQNPKDYLRIMLGLYPDNEYFRNTYFFRLYHWENNYFDLFFNDSRTLVRLNAVIRLFSFGVYNVHVIILCFLSFAGLTALYRFLQSAIHNNHKIFYAAIFLFPSVAFWTSGLLKESLVIFALGFTLLSLQRFSQKKSLKRFSVLVVFCCTLAFVKFYYLIALLPAAVGWLWSANKKKILPKYFLTHIGWILLVLFSWFGYPYDDVAYILSQKQNNFIEYADSVKAGSIITTEKLQPHWSDMLANSPRAFLITFTTPLEFSTEKIFSVLASCETVFVFVMIFIALIFFKWPQRNDYPILLFLFSFIIITYTLIGLSTPVAGALVRYKALSLPFLIFLILYFANFDKIRKLFASANSKKKTRI